MLAFVIESIESTINANREHDVSSFLGRVQHFFISIFILCTFGPLTWVRKIQRFRFAFIFGVMMILLAILTISIYCFNIIGERDNIRPPDGYFSIN